MQDTTTLDDVELSPLMEKLRINKEGAFIFRRRRHNDWTDNYTLYRDKVQLNRLLQRQSVNIPLIKTTIKTLLKDIDDAPMLYFTNLDNNDQAEVFYNEYWKHNGEANKLIIKDIVDKRQVLLFGRSFKVMNIVNGMFMWEVIDPQDILVDRYIDPSNLDSARFIIIEHTYKPLSSLRSNPMWDTKAVRKLQDFHESNAGLIKAQANQLDFVDKQSRIASMGVVDAFSPIIGKTYVELNQFFIKEWNEKLGEDEIRYVVTADNMQVLFEAPLEQVIGVTQDHYWRSHYPITTWGDETERTDFWCDGVADALRTPNKVLNAYFSQDVENRTMRNFGMTYFNSSLGEEGFTPQTFTPEPFGWYPIPAGQKNIGDVLQRVEIPELNGNMEMMNFLLSISDKASAASTTQQGAQEDKQVTLGEVQLALKNSTERIKSMAIYYTDAWQEFGTKYVKMLEATSHLLDPQTIHRAGRLTKKMYTKTISPEDWYSKSGFKVEVQMQAERSEAAADSLQWLNASRQVMPNNAIVDEEYKKTLLENAKLPATKISEALKLDKQQQEAQQQMMQQQAQMGQPQPVQAGQPQAGQPMQLPAQATI